MSSGKTTALVGKMGELDAIQITYAAFQPSIDVRSEGIIVPKTHNGVAKPNCLKVPSLLDISEEQLRGAKAIAIDEFTLFGFDDDREPITGYYRDSMRHLAELGVSAVYGAGLNVAANGEMFPLLKSAIENGAKIEVFDASCTFPTDDPNSPVCAKEARTSQIYSKSKKMPYDPSTLPMLLPQGERPDLGYRPVCVGHMAINAAELLDFNADYPS